MEKEKGLYSKNTIGVLLFKIVLPRYKLDYFYERITQECKMCYIFKGLANCPFLFFLVHDIYSYFDRFNFHIELHDETRGITISQ